MKTNGATQKNGRASHSPVAFGGSFCFWHVCGYLTSDSKGPRVYMVYVSYTAQLVEKGLNKNLRLPFMIGIIEWPES